jgi:hypothetical protein
MNHYNATTGESLTHIWMTFLNVIGIFSFTAVITEVVLQSIKYRDFGRTRDEGEDDEDDEDEDGEGEGEGDYTDKYYNEYKDLKERELDEVDFLTLNTQYVKEETPGGHVVMSYDKDTDCFCYYTDNLKEITYDILETVARKFVVDNDCKIIYSICKKAGAEVAGVATGAEVAGVATGAEVAAGAAAATEVAAGAAAEVAAEVAADADDEAPEQAQKQKPTSVFAKFKKYNTGGKGSVPNFKAAIDVVEQTNHFRFKGKIYDYEEIVKRNEAARNVTETSTLDYAAYKKQLLEKNKKED